MPAPLLLRVPHSESHRGWVYISYARASDLGRERVGNRETCSACVRDRVPYPLLLSITSDLRTLSQLLQSARTRTPDVLFQAHSAPLGLRFYNPPIKTFPAKYRNGAYVPNACVVKKPSMSPDGMVSANMRSIMSSSYFLGNLRRSVTVPHGFVGRMRLLLAARAMFAYSVHSCVLQHLHCRLLTPVFSFASVGAGLYASTAAGTGRKGRGTRWCSCPSTLAPTERWGPTRTS